MYEEDLISDKPINLEISGYPEGSWQYQPITGETELRWLDEYYKNEQIDRYKLNKLRLLRITSVPYDKEFIQGAIGLNNHWSSLTDEQKWQLLSKLSTTVINKLLEAIQTDLDGEKEIKKNSYTKSKHSTQKTA